MKLGDKVVVKGKSGVGRIWAVSEEDKSAIVRYESPEYGPDTTKWIPLSTIFAAPEAAVAA